VKTLTSYFRFISGTAGALALGLCAFAPRSAHAGLPAGFGFTDIATGLTQPMSFAYAPDGRIFVAERAGIVKIIKPGGGVATFLDMRAQVNAAWGRGILSIVLDPNFATNKRFYMLYHEELTPADPDQGGSARWRVVRLTPQAGNPDAADLASMVTLATDLETTAYKSDPHSGGDLDFDLNGNLLATFGDGATPSALDPEATKSYDYTKLNGKMIRIDPNTGNGVAANPYYDAANPGSNRSKMLARGLRQPFRFTVDRATGTIYEGDVGWDTWEELNVIQTSGWTLPRDVDYGWPCYEGGNASSQQQPIYFGDGRTSGTCNTVASEGTRAAVYAYTHSGRGAAIIMGKAYRGTTYPAGYQGKVFWADHNRDEVWTYSPGGGVTMFGTGGGYGSVVDFEQAPDGNLAYLSYNEGRLREIVYLAANHAPVAGGSATYQAGTSYAYAFSSAGSSDSDGDPLTYAWAFGDGTTGSGASVTHTYAFGSYDAVLTVSDGRGGTATKALHVDAGNRPPVVSFLSPADNSKYAVGDVVQFQIQATDADEGTLAGDRVTWQAILHHEDHTHADQEVPGLTGQFTATFPELVDTWYEIKAVAKDHNGGVTAKSLTVLPRKVDVSFVSTPTGAGFTVDGTARTAPYTQSFIVGSVHTALANTALGTQAFLSWTANGATTTDRNLSFTVPGAAATLSMAYGTAPYAQVYVRGTNNAWATNLKMATSGGNQWSAQATFGSTASERFKFDINGDWTLNFGDNAPADGIADQGGADILITQGAGNYAIAFDGNTKRYSVTKGSAAQDPVARAGADIAVAAAGGTIQLDGSASSDADGTIAAYLWTQIAGPALALSSATAAKPAVTVPAAAADQAYAFELKVTDNDGRTGKDTVAVKQSVSTWKRTVIFMYGQTVTGQDMFLRGGLDHTYANTNLGRSCATTNFQCAMPIRHLNLRNATTAPWKQNDNYLDWYGTEAGQSTAAPGSPADWTTDYWPPEWGPKKTVAVDGHGEEPLNHWGQHYWMLDVEMDCSKTVNGWFEVKSFISNGPGWEPNLAQPGAPYVSGNHFGKCGEINMFKRGSNVWEHSALP
jgi:hypothetical protein